MKKIIAAMLCLSMVLCFFGCDTKKNVIDFGGGIGKVTFEGDAYGSYKVIETPEEFKYEGCEITVYEDLTCDTPYIVLYRYSKEGMTLEEVAQEEADELSNGYYQIFDKNSSMGHAGAYMAYLFEYNGNIYYNDLEIVEDGEDFVEIVCCAKTEELQIGTSNVYAWVPVGYTSKMDDDYKEHKAIFVGSYTEDYYFPFTYVGQWEYSYDFMEWYLYEDYPDGLPFTKEEYDTLMGNWTDTYENMETYYRMMGDTITYCSYTDEKHSFDYDAGFYVLTDGKDQGTEAWFKVNDSWYVAWFGSSLNPKPAIAAPFLLSLHTK